MIESDLNNAYCTQQMNSMKGSDENITKMTADIEITFYYCIHASVHVMFKSQLEIDHFSLYHCIS